MCVYIDCFAGGVLNEESLQQVYQEVVYTPTVTSIHNWGDNNFYGFNFRLLQANMLHYWYHDGLMDTTDSHTTYFKDYLSRVTRVMDFNSPRLPIRHLQWLQWGVSILHNVLSFIEHYYLHKIQEYAVEDKNRVSLVAWECALTMLDEMEFTQLLTPGAWAQKLSMEESYIKYFCT